MYHVSTQGVDEHMINVHYYYYDVFEYLLKKANNSESKQKTVTNVEANKRSQMRMQINGHK